MGTIVGISGKIGSGKTKLAEILFTHFGYEPKIFAGKLKEIAAILTGLPVNNMYFNKSAYLEEWGMTVGELQQKLGTDAIRWNLHGDAWVIALFNQYNGLDNWSISDVRFPNEARAIKERGGFLVRIEGSRTGPGKRDPNHESETSLDHWTDWDYTFNNERLTYDELVVHARRIHDLATHR